MNRGERYNNILWGFLSIASRNIYIYIGKLVVYATWGEKNAALMKKKSRVKPYYGEMKVKDIA